MSVFLTMNVLTVYAHHNPRSFCHAVLDRFATGLKDGGHTNEIVDLHAIDFDPVFRARDVPNWIDESIPSDLLDRIGGPLRRFLLKRRLKDKDDKGIIKMLREHGPADVAAQQRKIGYSRGRSFLVALLTGLVEFVGGAVLGVVAVAFSEALLPWGMGFAAGAMLFVISNEIIPESHLEGQGLAGTVGVIVGFLVMMILDTAFA